jgi:hypothetical protein
MANFVQSVQSIANNSTLLAQIASKGIQFGLAACAIVALNPYIIWGQQKFYYALISGILIIFYILYLFSVKINRHYLVFATFFSLFLIYISILPKVDHGHVRWFFLIPFTWILLTVDKNQRNLGFSIFFWIFTVSLIPGFVLWLFLLSGAQIQVDQLSHINPGFAAAGARYFKAFGAIFLYGNFVPLPNGGLLTRLCAVYDEPGTVGTIAALSIASTMYNFRDIRCILSIIAGFISFSMAFLILTFIGCSATSVLSKRPKLLIICVLCLIFGTVQKINVFSWYQKDKFETNITLKKHEGDDDVDKDPLVISKLEIINEFRLRPSKDFDNRMTSSMKKIFEDYLKGSAKEIAFGIGSDISQTFAVTSSSWKLVLTNYGVIGFIWLFLLFFIPVVYLLRVEGIAMSILIFCVIYAISFYQRPVIWLPNKMLIFFSAIHYPLTTAKNIRKIVF